DLARRVAHPRKDCEEGPEVVSNRCPPTYAKGSSTAGKMRNSRTRNRSVEAHEGHRKDATASRKLADPTATRPTTRTMMAALRTIERRNRILRRRCAFACRSESNAHASTAKDHFQSMR